MGKRAVATWNAGRKSANFRVSDEPPGAWFVFPMHKRFTIALQTACGFADGASSRRGPGLGNGGKPARRCGELFVSGGSETGLRQPRFSAGTSEAPARQPRFSAGTSEAPTRQPRFSAGTSEAPARQPRFSAEAPERGDVKVHDFSPNAAAEGRRPGNVKAQGEALGWLHKPYAALQGRDKTVAAIFVTPLQGLALFLPSPLGFTQGYYIPHLRRSNAPRRLPSLTTFAARQTAAHFRHAKLG